MILKKFRPPIKYGIHKFFSSKITNHFHLLIRKSKEELLGRSCHIKINSNAIITTTMIIAIMSPMEQHRLIIKSTVNSINLGTLTYE